MFKNSGAKPINPKNKKGEQGLDFEGFNALLDFLSPLAEADDDDMESLSIADIQNKETDIEVQDGDDDEGDDEEEISIEDAFNEISGGKKSASMDAVFKWDLVTEMIEDGVIDKNTFEEEFKKASNGKAMLTFEGFEALLENLEPYAEEEEGEDGADNEISFEDAFNDISGGKKTVSKNAVLNI